ncbi:MAG: polysaccharide deacetylase family protein [Bacteroidetes bacterium]|nr:polysaccharide deacetylase family protein [Bacteroidota bacterium]
MANAKNILTFDIEEWFHILDSLDSIHPDKWNSLESRIEGNMEIIFRILQENNMKATFFVVGWIADKYPHLVKKISALGFEIGSHSDQHQIIWHQNKREFENDLISSISKLEQLSGKAITMYRAPGFSLVPSVSWAFDILAKSGIKVDSSVSSTCYGYNDGSTFTSLTKPAKIITDNAVIKELPMSSFSMFGNKVAYAGGGWFRLIPSLVLERLFANSDYSLSYFHPREFDKNHPAINDLPLLRKLLCYYGVKNCEQKLIYILKKYQFTDITDAVNTIDWNSCPQINLTNKQVSAQLAY